MTKKILYVHVSNTEFYELLVSALGNVHTLDLSHYTLITDVSALGNMHTLNLFES